MPTSVEAGGAQWVDFADDFLFYANVIRASKPDGSAVQFRWPREATVITGPIADYPFDYAEWGNGTKRSTAACRGVSIRSSDVGTTNTPSRRIVVKPVPNTFTNTFFATVRNDTEVNGVAQQADNVRVRFRIARWGLPGPGDWQAIEVDNPGCPDATLQSNPTCPQDIPAAAGGVAGSTTFNLNGTVPDDDMLGYLANEHQCILVELGSPSDASIVTKSVYGNMEFPVTASSFKRDARISAKGYPPPPNDDPNQQFLINVTKRGWSTSPKSLTAVGVDVGNQASYLTWGAHGYRRLGKDIIVNESRYEIVEPIGLFGYVVQHVGLAVENWRDELIGAELVHDGIDQFHVPHNGEVTLTTQIVPRETGVLTG